MGGGGGSDAPRTGAGRLAAACRAPGILARMTPTTPRPWRGAVATLGRPEEAALALLAAGRVTVRERLVGQPAIRSRRLTAGGVEAVTHDFIVAAVVLRLPDADLRAWLGVGSDATLDDLERVFGHPAHFAGLLTPYVAVEGGFVRFAFPEGGWKARGNLRAVTFVAQRPGEAPSPDADDCATCADLPVRNADGLDLPATVAALAAASASGRLREDAAWVRLADLLPLGASGLMERAESQATCTACGRVTCLTVVRGGGPLLTYCTVDEARRRPMGPIPPVERWGDPGRVRQEASAMRYVDHEPGRWFLVEQGDALFLHARYSYSAVIDDSVLIRLDAAELAGHRDGGRAYLTALAERIHTSAPYDPASPFHERDLYRGEGEGGLRDAVMAAIANHTWLAEQRGSL